MSVRRILAVATIGLALAAPAQGEVIVSTYDFLYAGTSGAEELLSFESIGVGVFDGLGETPETRFLVTSTASSEFIEITPADVGTSWTSDPAMSSLIISQFQDADMFDSIGIVREVPPEGTLAFSLLSESNFQFIPSLDHAVIASKMDSLRVTLDSFTTAAPGSHPIFPDDWTYEAHFRFDFLAVPEPSTAASLLLMCGVLRLRRRRRQ